jgi:acylphosphatase
MSAAMKANRYLVTGRVQGVGFRYFVEEEATSVGVTGWVRNLADGRVEVLAAGDDAQLGQLEKKLWEGPPLARVTSVDVEPAAAPDHEGFHIRSTA